jgi:DNA-binding XRE family transcriptional regulator
MSRQGSRGDLVSLRKKAGLTQAELGAVIGLSRQAVYEWEHGLATPKLYPWDTLKLCEALNCSLPELAKSFQSDDD